MGFPQPARSRLSRRSSSDEDFLARFPVSGHSIGTADFGGLNFGYAAYPAGEIS
jgi:hypothetical protein